MTTPPQRVREHPQRRPIRQRGSELQAAEGDALPGRPNGEAHQLLSRYGVPDARVVSARPGADRAYHLRTE